MYQSEHQNQSPAFVLFDCRLRSLLPGSLQHHRRGACARLGIYYFGSRQRTHSSHHQRFLFYTPLGRKDFDHILIRFGLRVVLYHSALVLYGSFHPPAGGMGLLHLLQYRYCKMHHRYDHGEARNLAQQFYKTTSVN